MVIELNFSLRTLNVRGGFMEKTKREMRQEIKKFSETLLNREFSPGAFFEKIDTKYIYIYFVCEVTGKRTEERLEIEEFYTRYDRAMNNEFYITCKCGHQEWVKIESWTSYKRERKQDCSNCINEEKTRIKNQGMKIIFAPINHVCGHQKLERIIGTDKKIKQQIELSEKVKCNACFVANLKVPYLNLKKLLEEDDYRIRREDLF